MRLPVTAVDTARRRLRESTVWSGDRLATLHWWADGRLLRVLGPALASLHADIEATVVAGVQSSGYLLAPLAANHLGVGMLGIQKLHTSHGAITLATASGTPAPGDRVLLVDDILETGAQAGVVRDLVIDSGATWLGAAVMVTYREMPEINLKSLLHINELRLSLPRNQPYWRYGSFLEAVVDLCVKSAMLAALIDVFGATHA